MKFTSRILPLAFVLLAVHINLSHQKSRSFGQSCSSSERCDPQGGTVSCNLKSQQCECKDPATMVYDGEFGECVSVEGASCFMRRLRNRSVRNCIAGTTCVPLSSKSVFGTCVSSQESGEVLEKLPEVEDAEDAELFAELFESSPSTSTEGVVATGSTPDAGTGSTPEAETGSTPEAETGSTPEAETGSTPEAETGSTPDAGTEATTDAGTTSEPVDPPKGHDEPCNDDGECIAYAKCEGEETKKVCKCGGDFLPQEGNKKCARKEDTKCSDSAAEECVANAHCMNDKCMCNEEYSPKDGACAALIDATCDKDSVCLVENANCNIAEGWTNGTCECKDNLKPNDKKDTCSSAVMNAINFTLFIVLVSSSYAFNKFNH